MAIILPVCGSFEERGVVPLGTDKKFLKTQDSQLVIILSHVSFR